MAVFPDREPLRVLTAGATREGLAACAAPFAAETGIPIATATTHGHLIRDRVLAGAAEADIVLLPADMIAGLAGRNLTAPGAAADIGTIAIGAAVRSGMPVPDVSTMEALEAALCAAGSIVLTEAPSGVHMDALIDRLGLRTALEPRIVRYDTGTMVNEHLAGSAAAAEIGFGVATEILFYRNRGVTYAGPVPEEVQMRLRYGAAALAGTGRIAEARRLLDYLATPAARRAFAETGVEQGETRTWHPTAN